MVNIRKIDLNLLVALDVLLDERNVSRAARRLNLSQPAVSGILNRLRATFDDDLFVRARQGIRPTPRALELIGPVKSVLHDIDDMLSATPFVPDSAEMVFSVAATDYAQFIFLAPLIRAVHAAAPGIRFAVVSTDARAMPDQLERQEIDFAVTVPEMAPPRCHAVELFRERYICAVRKDLPNIRRGMSLDRFCRFEHVLVTPTGDSFRGPTDDALAAIGRTRRVVATMPTFLSLPGLLQASDFVAVAPERLLAAFDHALRLFEPPVAIPDFPMLAVWHERTHRNPAHQWLREKMIEVAHDLPVTAAR
jgi:DNA-binding transcriptional LysR family regulator